MSAKHISRISILAALCIVLRVAFGAFPNIKPITAIYLVSLLHLKTSHALLVMALSLFGSAFLFGVSIVVLWQILAFTMIMLFWRYICQPFFRASSVAVALQSLLAGILAFLYGFLISLPIAYQFSTNVFVYWLNGLSFDLLHAVSTVLFYPIIYHLFRRFLHEKNNVSP